MMSHATRRNSERPATLSSLASVGFHPEVFESTNPPSSMENRRVAREVFAAGGPALFFEDDVTASESLPEWVAEAERRNALTTFCVITPACHPPEVKAALESGSPIPRGLVPIANPDKWYGAQAVYLPARVVDAMNTDQDFMQKTMTKSGLMWTGWDIWLRRNLERLGPMYAAFPNPVQHRDAPKLVPLGRRRPKRVSRTFGL